MKSRNSCSWTCGVSSVYNFLNCAQDFKKEKVYGESMAELLEAPRISLICVLVFKVLFYVVVAFKLRKGQNDRRVLVD